MGVLGNGLHDAGRFEDALSVQEAELSVLQRLGVPEAFRLTTQGNLASTYQMLGRLEDSLRLRQKVYSGNLKFSGEENDETLVSALNYAVSLDSVERFEDARKVLRKMTPVARRVLGDCNDLTHRMQIMYATTLSLDEGATLDDLREAVTTLEELERTARRVFGSAYPTTKAIERALEISREALRIRDVESLRDAVEAMTPG